MKLQNIIDKWDFESKDLASRMEFLAEHNFNHERDFLYERYHAIRDVLCDLKYNLDEEEE